MTAEAVIVATLLMLLGIGGGLAITGHRAGKPLFLWVGAAILTAAGAFIAIDAFFLVACWAGAGCI
jgi:hypothetical protein